jgi:2-succinyl-5-enolpyruvyl-6-hydroxy-3-cyclohexene-1-carboxylate synthase
LQSRRDKLPLPNPNIRWSELFVNELARAGLREVCIAPGSRSSPLALAFYRNSQIKEYVHLDERSAGYFALGLALASDKPVALLCTSGTAGANFFPAIIEAHMSQVPLLVLTADRPHELRYSGANQTIDQIKMYGDHVLWSVDVALPEQDPPAAALRNLESLAARSLAVASGLRKGPVHLNFPFRTPLEPANREAWLVAAETEGRGREAPNLPRTQIEHGRLIPSDGQIQELTELIERIPQGLIICGPRCPGGAFPEAVTGLAARSQYPILADALSGVRFGAHISCALVCGGYETYLRTERSEPAPEVILYFGASPTSKRLNSYLGRQESAYHIHVRENGVWADENHLTTHFLQLDARALCEGLSDSLSAREETNWLQSWQTLETTYWAALASELAELEFDGAYVYEIVEHLPQEGFLFLGNSLPVRHVDQFARPQLKALRAFANRGASGIDGNISSGLGVSLHTPRSTTIIVGDITFLHDSNGLFALRHLKDAGNVTIFVFNNDGGGIFQRLPIAQFEPPFSHMFRVPHGLDLSSIARTYELDYAKVESRRALMDVLKSPASGARARLVEIVTDAQSDHQIRGYLESRLGESGSFA